MSAPAPAAKPWPPFAVPLIGVGLVAAVVAAVVVFGGPSSKLSDGTDVRDPDPDLKQVADGVQYRDLKAGAGEPCPEGAKVKIHYTGWTPDGNVFDSSRSTGKVADFELDGLIKGWQEGIPGMKKGGVRKLVIAPEKGYGARSQPNIPANSTLTFEVELLGFSPPAVPRIKSRPRRSPAPADLSKLSDGTRPTADDANLKPIGAGGLLYRDLKVGDGPEVTRGADVVMDYVGWLRADGSVFDSSFKRAETFRSPLGGLIPGWQEGVPGMKVGGVRKLVIPPDMAYGADGRPGIPGGSTLVFEIEVLGAR